MEGSAEGNNESNERQPIGMGFFVFVLLITYLFYRLLVQFFLITNIGVYYDDTTGQRRKQRSDLTTTAHPDDDYETDTTTHL